MQKVTVRRVFSRDGEERQMIQLPEEYSKSMRKLLGDEYPDYEHSLRQESHAALRINTSKISRERWKEICPFQVTEVPWTDKGFYYNPAIDHPAKHPYYFAGLYYIQEPSAMIPASILPVEPGDRVLDLCAAPGGKATELAAKLSGEGILVANDISVSRTMALAKNLQMAGASTAVVTAETPEHLAEYFPEYFDRILIDAPCSGEGMFRREPGMVRDWLERGPDYYAEIQRQILTSAYGMLKPGGSLVYSTCTFSVTEDEGMIQWFLKEFPDMQICQVERKAGFSEGRPDMLEDSAYAEQLKNCIRIFPHRADGEGHFVVLLQKAQAASEEAEMENGDGRRRETQGWHQNAIPAKKVSRKKYNKTTGKDSRKQIVSTVDWKEEATGWIQKLKLPNGTLVCRKQTVMLAPEGTEMLQGLRIVQNGLILGECRNRLEPSPQLALALTQEAETERIVLSTGDIRVTKYLKGETIEAETDYKGYVLVCVDGYPLGWAKSSGNGILKNKYYAGWRLQ